MNINITPLSNVVGEIDAFATMKSFLVVFAFLFALFNLVLLSEVFVPTLTLHLSLEPSLTVVVAMVLAFLFSLLIPLSFVFWDWAARKPWSVLAFFTGSLLGIAVMTSIGAGIAMFGLVIEKVTESENMIGKVILICFSLTSLTGLILGLLIESTKFRTWLWKSACIIFFLLFLVLFSILFIQNPDARFEVLVLCGQFILTICGVVLALIAVKHRIILSSDVPRELLYGAYHHSCFWTRVAYLAGLPSSLWNKSGLKKLAFWLFLLSRPTVYIGALTIASVPIGLYPEKFLTVVFGILLVALGHLMFHKGKTLASRYVWEPNDLNSKEQPILFLRSFEDDQLTFKRSTWNILGKWLSLWSFRKNTDETMIDEVAQFGPVVALGSPTDSHAPYGASRYYASHDEWKDVITKTAREALTIVLVAGKTQGVKWEYKLLKDNGLLNKTLLLFSPTVSQEENLSYLKEYCEITGITVSSNFGTDERLIGIIFTDEGYQPLTASKPSVAPYLIAIRSHFRNISTKQLSLSLNL